MNLATGHGWPKTALAKVIPDELTDSSRRAAEGMGGGRDVQNESEQVDTDGGGRVMNTVRAAKEPMS